MSELEGFGFVMPHWLYWGWLAFMPLIMIALDRWRSSDKQPETKIAAAPVGEGQDEPPTVEYQSSDASLFTRAVDWMSDKTGLFISFWTVNAVCFYFFEVIMRYIFNTPTIWVHEASYLLLGMQYLLAGGFALLHGAHVRVDVVYNYLPLRGRVGMDIFTSMFFFMFALVLVLTSWTYFENAYSMGETTVETWGIQYWPVKGIMLLGSVMLLMAGISKLLKDISVFIRLGPEASE